MSVGVQRSNSSIDSTTVLGAASNPEHMNPMPGSTCHPASLTWNLSALTVQLSVPMLTLTSQGSAPCCSCGGVLNLTASLLTKVPSTIASPRAEVSFTRILPSLRVGKWAFQIAWKGGDVTANVWERTGAE